MNQTQPPEKKKRNIPVIRILLSILLLALVWKMLVFYRFQWYGADSVVSGTISLMGEERELTEEEVQAVIQALKKITVYPSIPEIRDGTPGSILLRGKYGSIWNFELGGDQMKLNFMPYRVPEKYQDDLTPISPYLLYPYNRESGSPDSRAEARSLQRPYFLSA